MRILFAGTPEVAVPSLRHLAAEGHEIVGVLTQPDGRARRGGASIPTPVKQAAHELFGADVPVLQPESLRDPQALAEIAALAPDVIPVVAYGNLVPRTALQIAPLGWVNLHFSLLPRWRGAAPVQRAIQAGDSTTGAAVFQIEAGLDTGPVFASQSIPLPDTVTAGEVLADLAASGAILLGEVVARLGRGDITGTPQSDTGATHAAKIAPEEAQIDWAQPHEVVHRLIRAVTPAPGAWSVWRGERCKVLSISAASQMSGEDAIQLAPGEVALHHKHLWVGTGTRPLQVAMVAPAGKKPMDAAAWIRGARALPGETFAATTPTSQGFPA